MILFAFLSGLRESEMNRLELSDLLEVRGRNPRIRVDKSVGGLPPKNGQSRELPMSPELVRVVKRWLAILPSYLNGSKNEHKLVFPPPNGCRVPDGQNAMRSRKGRSTGMRMARERSPPAARRRTHERQGRRHRALARTERSRRAAPGAYEALAPRRSRPCSGEP